MKRMDEEKTFVGKLWVWILFLIIITTVTMTGLSYLGLIGKTVVERKVFEQSYQKQEADKTASTAYSAQLAMLRRKLNNQDITASTRNEIQAQIDAITVLNATKRD